jgi:hypothetical protein
MFEGLIRAAVFLVLAGVVALVVIERVDSSDSSAQTAQTPSPQSPEPVAGQSQRARDLAADELGYYPPAPSRAVGMTAEWREFAATIDRVCATTYNYALAGEEQVHRAAVLGNWGEAKAEAARVAIWSHQGPQIQLAAAKLGSPPQKAGLFERWIANVMARSALYRRASRAAARGDFGREAEICDRIQRLKLASDRLGQRFGLRICTSN